MKWLKKYIKEILTLILTTILGFYVMFVAIPKVSINEIYKKPTVELKIYTIWHTETFEGGGKSRILYLQNIAKQIENSNAGILFNIKQINPENIANELENYSPDIISFGYGLGNELLPYLASQPNSYSIRDSLFDSGSFANKLYAIPYIVSGYARFSNSNESTEYIYGKNEYTNPNSALDSSLNYTLKESQYEAYKYFINNKNCSLVGTSRDLFRINNLNQTGRLNANISPISTYTDLIQYLSSTKHDNIIDMFIEKCLSSQYQQSLNKYSLFSSLSTKIYSTGIYNDMENAILLAKIPNVFNEK